MEDLSVNNLLRSTSLFADLAAKQINELAILTQKIAYQAGQEIFAEGDPATGFIIITSGRVKIVKYAMDGREKILHTFGPNQPVGEVAVFLGADYPAHCIAITDVELIFIKRDDFVAQVKAHPQLALEMLAVLAKRLQIMNQLIADLSLADAPGRLAKYLLAELAKNPGQNELNLTLSKNELAKLLGMTAETLSRIFSRLKKNGVLEIKGRQIRVCDPEQLISLQNI